MSIAVRGTVSTIIAVRASFEEKLFSQRPTFDGVQN
jgi:hypothetical protein